MALTNSVIETISKIPGLKKIYRKIIRKDLICLEEITFNELLLLPSIDIDEQAITQETRLTKLLEYANVNCPYYNQLFYQNNISVASLRDFKRIPLLDKMIIKQNASKILSTKAKTTERRKSNTGGSTGEPLEFYTDMNSIAVDNAHHKYLYHLMGWKPGDLIADSGGIRLNNKLRMKNTFWIKYPDHSIWGDWGFSALYLNKKNINFYVDKILELKPTIFRGYPSFFQELSIYILQNKINLEFRIKGINLTAEYCSEEQRIIIERAFHSKVFLEYGQGEKTLFCYSDGEEYYLKSSPVYGYVEVLNENGVDVLPGEEGEVVVTGLSNFSMPFIRYRTGDRAILKSRVSGIVTFEKILGRTQDFILDQHGQKIYLTSIIFGQHYKAFKEIIQWQIIQEKKGFIKFNIVKGNNFSINDEFEILKKIKDVSDLDVKIDYVENTLSTKSGKKLFLIQKITEVQA
ncbi:MAG: hypothetical protein Q8M94_21265 [Ignavibacteria bacterium]|nr:hypothetical protein [Ignavibacteria bacterium]